eukprot:328037_1
MDVMLYPVGSTCFASNNHNNNKNCVSTSTLHPYSDYTNQSNSSPKQGKNKNIYKNQNQNQDQISIDGCEWSNDTDIKSKILIKQLVSNTLKHVDMTKNGFKRNEWYIHID